MAARTLAAAFAIFPAAAYAATPSDPCAIPASLVSSALGTHVSFTTTATTDGMKSCTFRTGKTVPYATIANSRQSSVAVARALYRMQIGVAAGEIAGMPTIVHGIGDEAAAVDGFLYARKGTALYQFGVVDYGPQLRSLPNVQRLAKAVLATVKP